MRSSLILLIVLCSCQYRFERHFEQRVADAPVVLFSNAHGLAESAELDVTNFDQEQIGSVLFSTINKERDAHHRPKLEYDSLYNRIAQTILTDFDGKKFLSSKAWYDQRRSINYILQVNQSQHKIYSLHAFRLDILNQDQGNGFYYDKIPGTSPFDLYDGKRPKDEKDVVAEEPVPLAAVTIAQLSERFIDVIQSRSGGRDLYSQNYDVLGLGVKPDPDNANHKQRPRLLVVIVFGGKKLHRVKLPEELQKEMYNLR